MATTSTQKASSSRIPLYTPLDRSRTQIRFIEILPSDTDEESVSCLLKVAELTPGARYAALSYVWGDPKIKEDIMVNGVTLPVTTNLASALRHFRRSGFPKNQENGEVRQLWADAICINQDDIPERNHQVTLMRPIYRNATSVLSWLGPPGPDRLNFALQVIRQIAPVIGASHEHSSSNYSYSIETVEAGFEWLMSTLGPVMPEPQTESAKWMPIRELYRNIYWRRVWIIQEIVLARSPWVHWFIVATILPQAIRQSRSPGSSRFGPKAIERESWFLLSDAHYLPLRMLSVIGMMQGTVQSESFNSKRDQLFGFICLAAMNASATNPRDFVYAMLGMAPNDIEPDYNKTVPEVYLDAVLSDGIMNNGKLCLEASGRGYDSRNDHNLPSWLLDLSKLYQNHANHCIDTRAKADPLLGIINLEQPEVVRRNILHIRGVTCSLVEHIKLLRFTSDMNSNKNVLYELCINYLTDFGGPVEATHRRQRGAEGRPLQALIDVLDWKKKDSRSKIPKFLRFSGPQLSPISWLFFYILLDSPLGQDEEQNALRRLNVPPNATLEKYMADCLADTGNLSLGPDETDFWAFDTTRREFTDMLSEAGGRTLFQTDKGQLGIGPPNVKSGDLVCAVDLCSLPILLRRCGSYLEHIGSCYVLGLSDGEPADMIRMGTASVETFEIH
ncbi:heterokaryon incompatibility protein-domain-containing protein [Hypoxylon crocopeplum]|nr:heterokaryon incompatibility protein-domain-containing protein [Hypoxylon crocopeplum]